MTTLLTREVLTDRLPLLDKQIEKFNKKADKFGLPRISYTVTKTSLREIKKEDALGFVYDVKYIEISHVDIIGEIPMLDGWKVHSRIEPAEVAGQNYVYTAAGNDPVETLRTCELFCEHCQTRRRRSVAYYMENVDGRHILVGKQCVKDFFKSNNMDRVVDYVNYIPEIGEGLDEYDEGMSFGGREPWVYPLESTIAEAIALIKREGYVSKKAAQEWNDSISYGDDGQPTRPHKEPTSSSMCITDSKSRECVWTKDQELELRSDEMKAEVQKVIDFIKGLNAEGNDFVYNLQLAVAAEGVRYRLKGYIAAAVNMYFKSLETAAEKEAKAKRIAERSNEWVGKIGERRDFNNLKCMSVFVKEGEWGYTYITRFEDEAGNLFVWFASSRVADVDEVVSIKATIKNHDEYQGRKQTIITRGKVL